MEDELPIHHSFVVLDDHMLDLSISLKSEDFTKLDSMTKIYKELRKIYPQHPCFQDVKNGTTRGQEILLRKK